MAQVAWNCLSKIEVPWHDLWKAEVPSVSSTLLISAGRHPSQTCASSRREGPWISSWRPLPTSPLTSCHCRHRSTRLNLVWPTTFPPEFWRRGSSDPSSRGPIEWGKCGKSGSCFDTKTEDTVFCRYLKTWKEILNIDVVTNVKCLIFNLLRLWTLKIR